MGIVKTTESLSTRPSTAREGYDRRSPFTSQHRRSVPSYEHPALMVAVPLALGYVADVLPRDRSVS